MNNRGLKFNFSVKEQVLFANRMHYLLEAGLGLKECLMMIYGQSESGTKRLFYKALHHDISAGLRLSASLKARSRKFSPLAFALIMIGEEGGSLSENLSRLSSELSKRQEMQRKLISALVYPIFIALATCALSLFLILYIFPKIKPLFISLAIPLPLTTRMLLASSTFLGKFWLIVIIGLALLCTVSIYVYRTCQPARRKIYFALMRIPFANKLIKNYCNAACLRYIHLLLQGGLPVDESLSLTSQLMTFAPYSESLSKMHSDISSGMRFADCLLGYPGLYPRFVHDMVALGEATGTLALSCGTVVRMYEQELDDMTKAMSSLLEPVLMLGMGAIVGTIALSIITPLYAITENLHH